MDSAISVVLLLLSREWQEPDAYWRTYLNLSTSRLEHACFLIDLEHECVVGRLVLCDEVFAAGVHREIARRFTQSRLISDACELARFAIDRKNCDAVVSAI